MPDDSITSSIMQRDERFAQLQWLTLSGHIKTAEHGPLYINTVIGTLTVDGWAITFGTARRGLGGFPPSPAQSPPHCTKCNSPPINGQCTDFILFDVAHACASGV